MFGASVNTYTSNIKETYKKIYNTITNTTATDRCAMETFELNITKEIQTVKKILVFVELG